jgi:ATP-dependent protease HslVU (ClpYQ) ATPase subunit
MHHMMKKCHRPTNVEAEYTQNAKLRGAANQKQQTINNINDRRSGTIMKQRLEDLTYQARTTRMICQR